MSDAAVRRLEIVAVLLIVAGLVLSQFAGVPR